MIGTLAGASAALLLAAGSSQAKVDDCAGSAESSGGANVEAAKKHKRCKKAD